MDTATSDTAITNDVLHLGSQSKLSPEEIAKALAHHNRHHGGNAVQAAGPNTGAGKKNKASKSK
jgi:stage V sporulation protein SpoVS